SLSQTFRTYVRTLVKDSVGATDRKRNTKLFGRVPRRTYGPRCFPHLAPSTQLGSPTSHGSTYIEIHISPPCSNPRSAPPPRRGVFCCAGVRRGLSRLRSPTGGSIRLRWSR